MENEKTHKEPDEKEVIDLCSESWTMEKKAGMRKSQHRREQDNHNVGE